MSIRTISIRTILIIIFAFLVSFFGGCQSKEKSVEVKEKGTDAAVTETETDEEKEQQQDWYVKGDTLYINKIYYSIVKLAGNQYVYETPWVSYDGEIKKLVVSANMEFMKEYLGEPAAPNEDARNQTGLFAGFDEITDAEININMGDVEDASFMLSGCENLENARVSLSGNVKYASYMFATDSRLKSASVSITSGSMEEVQSMFQDCSSLVSAVTSFDGNIERCAKMYYGCESLQTAAVPFDINEDTMFSDMFANCSSLKKVDFSSVNVSKGGRSFFNNDNSIVSYEFAGEWNVNTENMANPIGDSIYNTIVVPVGGKGQMFEFIVYSKARPEWFREYIEKIHRLDNFMPIHESSAMDIYYSGQGTDAGSELTTEDVIDACAGALAEMDKEAGDGKFAALKDCYDIITDIKDAPDKVKEHIEKMEKLDRREWDALFDN